MATKFQTQFAHGKVEPFKCETPSMTEQQFEFETNINNIVACNVQSALPAQTSQAILGITLSGDEFEQSLNANAEVLNYFEELPVKAKEFFNYKPKEMLDFINQKPTEEICQKAFDIGLIDKKSYFARKEEFAKIKGAELDKQNAANAGTSKPEVTPNSVE